MSIVILDLCGGTGAWSKPYKDAGHDVKLCTLPEVDVTHIYFGRDQYGNVDDDYICITACNKPVQYIYIPDIYGILAAPPCTEFSIAKGDKPRDKKKGMETVEACMKIIWEVEKRTTLKFWALENPRGLLRRFLGIPKYTFEQWQFGTNRRKATDIWGYFRIPTPTVSVKPEGLTVRDCKSRVHATDWAVVDYPEEYTDYINQFKGDAKRAAARAITPAGFAEAFYRANKC
jgi:hypothetical protein